MIGGIVTRFKTFWPMLAGIVFARTALIVACYGSYTATDDGIFTDGAMLVTCALFAVILLLALGTKRHLSESMAQVIFIVSTVAAAASSAALSTFDPTDNALFPLGFGLSVISTVALSLCMFFWLRALRGADEVTAVLFAFGAFIVSVAVVYLIGLLSTQAQNVIGAILIMAQLALLGPASLRTARIDRQPYPRGRTFFTFARSHIQDGRFLTACAAGMGALSFVDGFLRGYPDGLPIPFTGPTRFAYAAVAIIVCVLLIALVVRRRERVMTVGVFITMELLACVALVLFSAFPQRWEIGAVAVNTLNVVICAYCWYVVIAFTSFGHRDPYVYAMGGWIICFGLRSVARMLLFGVYSLTGNDLLITSALGALILISTQVVLVQFLLAEHREGAAEAEVREAQTENMLRQAEADVAQTQTSLAAAEAALQEVTRNAAEHEAARVAEAVAAVQKAAFEAVAAAQAERCIKCTDGCSPQQSRALRSASPPEQTADTTGAPGVGGASGTPSLFPATPGAPSAPMVSDELRSRVRAMGERFLLSDREVDVLMLYALGYTQKKVGEALHITPATAHTHIKRIYGKCGLHSRQEILEYLATYGF